jgi:hypothetical protein
MAHPWHHALSSTRRFGGVAEDYLALHSWFDESKLITADFRHRALRHHAEGIFMAERFFRHNAHNLDRTKGSSPADRRAACHRGSGFHPELRGLGALHPPRTVDGPRATAPQNRRTHSGRAGDDPHRSRAQKRLQKGYRPARWFG